MAMNLRQLEAFKAVIENGTVSQAAEVLRISQPAVSKLIAALEHGVGFTIFERVRGRLVPTPEAGMLYAEVERAFVGVKEISRAVDSIRDLKKGRLIVGVIPALASGFIQEVITDFQAERPDITVSMHSRSSIKIHQQVAASQFELGITASPIEHSGVETEFLCRVEALCVLPPGHRLANRELIEPQDLEGEPFISLSALDHSRQRIDHPFEEAGVRRDLRIETPMGISACAFVAKGAGVSIVDPFSALEFQTAPIVAKPFRPAVAFDIALRYPLNRRRSHLIRTFAAAIHDKIAAMPDLPLVALGERP